MKNLTFIKLLALGILFTVSPKSFSTILITDNFNYATGQLATNGGWRDSIMQNKTGTGLVNVADTTLSYPGYLSSNVGKSIYLDGDNRDAYHLFPHIEGTTTAATTGGRVTTDGASVYSSMLVNVEQAPDGDTKGDCFFGYSGNKMAEFAVAGRIYTKKSGEGFVFGVTRVGYAKIVWDTIVRSLNTTYLVVLKYTIHDGVKNDRVYLAINPALGATEPTWIENNSTDGNGELANLVGSVIFLQHINTSAVTTFAKIKVGGLRVATTWAEVGDLDQANGLQANTSAALNVKVSNSNLSVRAEIGKTLEVYNAVGKRIALQQIVNAETVLPIATKGMYIVKVGNDKVKVIL